MWSVFAAASIAALSPAQELTQELHAHPEHELALICSPLGAVADLAQQIPAVQSVLNVVVEDADARAYLDNWLDRSSQHALGLDPGGSMAGYARSADGKGETQLALSFGGSPAQARSLLDYFSGHKPIEAEGPGWKFGTETVYHATLKDGTLQILPEPRTPVPSDVRSVTLPLLQALPEGAGCILAIDMRRFSRKPTEEASSREAAAGPKAAATTTPSLTTSPEGAKASADASASAEATPAPSAQIPEPEGMVLFTPLAPHQPLSLRISVRDGFKWQFPTLSGRPLVGTSQQSPLLVAALQFPLLEALTSPNLPGGSAKIAEQIEPIRKKLRIDGGTTLALFADPQDLAQKDFSQIKVVVALPVRQASGLPVTGGGMRRNLQKLVEDKKDGSTAEKLSRRRLKLTMAGDKPSVMYLESRWNQLWIASSNEVLDEALSGKGQPWVDGDFRMESAHWPVLTQVKATMPDGSLLGLTSGIALTTDQLRIDFQLQGKEQVAQAVLSSLIQSLGVPAIEKQKKVARRTELNKTVEAIAVAELAYFAAHGKYLETSSAPRPVDECSSEAVIWTPGDEWDALDLSFEPLHGVYWVELTEEGKGFVVHGVADLDDDRVISHVVKSHDSPTLLLTPADVF